MRYELIRNELEKKYTHVTFVRTDDLGKRFESTVWYVNDEMVQLVIPTKWKVDEILYNLEVQKLARIANKSSEKYAVFKVLMRAGIIEIDHTLYKKTTLKKLLEMQK